MMTAAQYEPTHWRHHRGRGPVAHAYELIYRLRAVLGSLPEHRLAELRNQHRVLNGLDGAAELK